ncbi:MAG TPA: helix-turn-helix transcriptional regulator [Jatrophihabitantaceae bacterium]|jgi:transcriptional regulator with XRE-family HTH domain
MRSDEIWRAHAEAFGEYLRNQRQLAEMSLRELAAHTRVSNAYLSQIERGMHQPSVRVIRAVAEALGIPPDKLLARAGMLHYVDAADDRGDERPKRKESRDVEAAIRAEDRLTEEQKRALISVFRSYLAT